MKELEELAGKVEKFAIDRDWNQFHSPKNLSMALSVEAAELLQEFQWLTEDQSYNLDGNKKQRVQDELGDILIYLIRLAAKLNIDLLNAANLKMAMNEKKYPVSKAKGNAKKYTEFEPI